jgi:hypothetical protein
MDCDNCIKDFCACVSKALAEDRKERSDKIRNKMIEWLEKNQINYELTNTKGIALLTSDNHQAYLSLATSIYEKKKIRLKGKGQWHRISADRVRKEFKKNK